MKKVNLFLSINEWCNLDCYYCNVYKTQKKLTFEEAKKSIIYFLKFFKNRDWYNIYFIWWEPMLSYKIIKKLIIFIKILEKKIWKDISISMPSNWTLFDYENLYFLQKYNVNISLSVDSLSSYYNYRNLRNNNSSSVSILLKKIDLFKKFSNILRIKIVVMPDMINHMKRTFLILKKLWFKFINMQPAHWVFWSDYDIEKYVENFEYIRDNLLNSELKSATFKGSECSDKWCTSWCAKWRSEISIDSYWNVFVCDAFLAFPPEKRDYFSHDNIFNENFNLYKFNLFKNWKYCNNTVIEWKKDLVNCEKCEEQKSCSTLCNAIPINWKDLDNNILISNFKLYHKLDKVWI